jgi:hypothetical protein
MDIPRDQGVPWKRSQGVLLVLFVFLSLVVFFRATTIFWTAGWLLALPFLSRPRRRRVARVFVMGFFLLLLVPVDVSTEMRPGLPKFVPIRYGLPAMSTFEQAERGEVVLGGCVVPLYPPRWALIW